MKISIGVKLSILIAILSFIIAMTLGKYANNLFTKELEIKTFNSLENLSTHIAEVLDREMLERYKEIRFASVMDILSDEKTTIEKIFVCSNWRRAACRERKRRCLHI